MDSALDRARVGERWVLRHRLPDGGVTDLVGWLTGFDARTVVVEAEGGQVTEVTRSLIIVARRAPAARGGPDPRRIPAEELERGALPGWVALQEPLGEWTLRAGGGFTGRANSVLAVGNPGLALPAAAARVIAYSRDHQIAPWAQVIVGSSEEAGLRALGWQPVYVTTDVLTCRLVDLLGVELPDPRVVIADTLDGAWWKAFGRSRPDPLNAASSGSAANPQPLRMILDGHPPRAFASVTGSTAGEDAAIARGHVAGPWLGVASVWIDAGWRRRGLATAMMRALGHWAARHGARYVYLQVAQENRAAHVAYERLGFALHHSYRYLAAPPHSASEDLRTTEQPDDKP